MTNLTPHERPNNLRDYGVSVIRTAVPAAWGYFLTWVATQVPALADTLNDPSAVGVSGFAVLVLTTAWYLLMRWLEPKLPAWLTVLVLGANARPSYGGVVVNGTVTGSVNIPRQAEGR